MKKNLTNNIEINVNSNSGSAEGNLFKKLQLKSINNPKVNAGKTINGKLKSKNTNSKQINVKPGQNISGVIKKK